MICNDDLMYNIPNWKFGMLHVCRDSLTCGFMISLSMNIIWIFSDFSYAWYNQHQHAKLERRAQGINRSGLLLLNHPRNNYLPLDYNLKWVEGGCLCANHGVTFAWNIIATQGSSLLLYMFSSILYNNWYA